MLMPICAEDWTMDASRRACMQMGYDDVANLVLRPNDNNQTATGFLDATFSQDLLIQQALSRNETASCHFLVSLTCSFSDESNN